MQSLAVLALQAIMSSMSSSNHRLSLRIPALSTFLTRDWSQSGTNGLTTRRATSESTYESVPQTINTMQLYQRYDSSLRLKTVVSAATSMRWKMTRAPSKIRLQYSKYNREVQAANLDGTVGPACPWWYTHGLIIPPWVHVPLEPPRTDYVLAEANTTDTGRTVGHQRYLSSLFPTTNGRKDGRINDNGMMERKSEWLEPDKLHRVSPV